MSKVYQISKRSLHSLSFIICESVHELSLFPVRKIDALRRTEGTNLSMQQEGLSDLRSAFYILGLTAPGTSFNTPVLLTHLHLFTIQVSSRGGSITELFFFFFFYKFKVKSHSSV